MSYISASAGISNYTFLLLTVTQHNYLHSYFNNFLQDGCPAIHDYRYQISLHKNIFSLEVKVLPKKPVLSRRDRSPKVRVIHFLSPSAVLLPLTDVAVDQPHSSAPCFIETCWYSHQTRCALHLPLLTTMCDTQCIRARNVSEYLDF